MPLSTVTAALHEWARLTVHPVPVVWLQQNAPRPALPYVGLRVSALGTRGHAAESEQDVLGNRTLSWPHELTLSVQGFGADSVNRIHTLAMTLESEVVHALLVAAETALIDAGPLTHISALLDDARFEDRAGMDVRFRFTGDYTELLSWIERVQGTGTINTHSEAFDVQLLGA